jgi:hypothetical protein
MTMPINLNWTLRGVANTDNVQSDGDILISQGADIRLSVGANLSAAGSTTTDAYVSSYVFNEVLTCGSGCGLRFVDAPAGSIRGVQNRGSNALTVYPPTGGSINGYTTNAGISVASGAAGIFAALTAGNLFKVA